MNAVTSNKELLADINHWLKAGFEEIDSRWRRYAVIDPASYGVPAYAMMLTLTDDVIASREYQQLSRCLGAGAAKTFNDLFWTEANAHGGPTWRESLSLTVQSLDSRMEGIEMNVNFRDGQQIPHAELIATDGNELIVRSFYDFGISSCRRTVEEVR